MINDDQIQKLIRAAYIARAMANGNDNIDQAARLGMRMLMVEIADVFKNEELLEFARSPKGMNN